MWIPDLGTMDFREPGFVFADPLSLTAGCVLHGGGKGSKRHKAVMSSIQDFGEQHATPPMRMKS
ncbi:hypothetical protein NC652_035738 [Populus alba x Populus x berolinensis]|nr:hypothetical protein NC652_035738 [Populus alba x Populus x berolinensis]